MGRIIALIYGLAVYAAFFITFLYSVGFIGNLLVPNNIDTDAEPVTALAIIINLILLSIFAIQHTIMARPGFKRWWTGIIPEPVERSTYNLLATAALALILWQWRGISGIVWEIENPTGILVVQVIFFVGWGILFLATFMIDHFDLFGLRQVVMFARGVPYTSPEFQTKGFYKLVRHPIMVGFIIAFWAAPTMTVGHLLFAVVTTVYIFIGVLFEEADLKVALGAPYENYQKSVYKFIPIPGKKG